MRDAVESWDRERVLLLLSGGLDSATLLAEFASQGAEVHAITFDYGQRHANEIEAAAELAHQYRVADHLVVRLDLRIGEASALLRQGPAVSEYLSTPPTGHVDTYVPMRNLMFIAHAACIAEARGIRRLLIGFNKDDAVNYWDCAATFVDHVNAMLRLSTGGAVQVEAPNCTLTKAEVVQRARKLGVRLERTVTCYAPVNHSPCGRCLACRLLANALGGT
jgi:7-cyano-7-deazaguanine synthase